MIAKITAFYIRRYSNNGQIKAYCEWIDAKRRAGRTEGEVPSQSAHMKALLFRALDEGVKLEYQTW